MSCLLQDEEAKARQSAEAAQAALYDQARRDRVALQELAKSRLAQLAYYEDEAAMEAEREVPAVAREAPLRPG